MTVADAIRGAAERLAAASDTARLDAELLMAHALDSTRSDMLIRRMDSPVPDNFGALIGRREAQEPVAYIMGVQEFYGREFLVTPDVLIPRPDSELLIEAALEHSRPGCSILDMGTGSGALLLTLMAEYPDAGVCHGFDNSEGALVAARRNAELHGQNPDIFRLFDWTDTKNGLADSFDRYDIVVCNPPYVETSAKLDEQVRGYEPHSALFAGEDGLDDYRIIIRLLAQMDPGVIILEIGYTQAEAVTALAKAQGFQTEIRCDLANRPRAAILTR